MNFGHCMDLVGCDYSHIPLPVVTLAALTPGDVEVAIVDENVEPVPLDTDADIVAFSAMLAQRERFLELAPKFRERGKFVAVGGAMVRLLADECRANADALFFGEAEYTWPRFIEDFRAATPEAEYRQEGWVNMDHSPMPRYDLLKADRYASACVQATRGCPFACAYCDVPTTLGKTPRSKPIDNVIREVRELSRMGFDSAFFVDDNFSANKAYAKALLRALIAARPTFATKMYFYTQETLLAAGDTELLGLYFKAGFRRLFIGIETSNVEHLRAVDKRHNTVRDIRKSVATIQAHGIVVWAGILFGFEGSTEAHFDEQKAFILETGIVPVQTGLLQAMPETPLYDRVKKTDRLRPLPSVMGGAGMGDRIHGPTTNIHSAGLSDRELNARFAVFLDETFSPRAFSNVIHEIGRRVPNRPMSTWPSLTLDYVKTLLKTTAYYLFSGDRDLRSLFFTVLFSGISGRANNLDELLFHLVIYKHMKTFYGGLARVVSLEAEVDRAAAE